MRPTAAWTTMTSMFGAASRSNVVAMGPSSSARVRGSMPVFMATASEPRGSRGDPVPRRRAGIAQLLRERAACRVETVPLLAVLQAGNRHRLALIEPGERRVDHVFRRHDDL